MPIFNPTNNTPGHAPNTKRLSIDVPAHLHRRFKAALPVGGMTEVLVAVLRALPKAAITKAIKEGTPIKFEIRLLP